MGPGIDSEGIPWDPFDLDPEEIPEGIPEGIPEIPLDLDPKEFPEGIPENPFALKVPPFGAKFEATGPAEALRE
jgi:hypothetical protein